MKNNSYKKGCVKDHENNNHSCITYVNFYIL